MDAAFTRRLASLAEAQAAIETIAALLAARGLTHRAPPPAPNTCCGRGCNGCVWEGYYAALDYWRADARALVQGNDVSPP